MFENEAFGLQMCCVVGVGQTIASEEQSRAVWRNVEGGLNDG